MNKKIEKHLRRIAQPAVYKASLGQIPHYILDKIIDKWIKFLDVAFKIITGITLSLAFLWFFPIYLGLGYERMTVTLLLIILIIIKLGTIRVKVE